MCGDTALERLEWVLKVIYIVIAIMRASTGLVDALRGIYAAARRFKLGHDQLSPEDEFTKDAQPSASI